MLGHLRQDSGHELDLLLERRDGALLGIEVKAAASVDVHDAKHLFWLQEQLGTKAAFKGVVFYTGNHAFALGPNVWALPICALWS
jgi:uncharacterized protein